MSVDYGLGDLGHFLLLGAFVGIGLAFCGFLWHSCSRESRWWRYGVLMYGLHVAALLGAMGLLFYLLVSDSFHYHYAWSHSMASLPISYKIASFWEGQEGSFLLWMFWQVALGLWVMRKNTPLRTEVLAVLCLVQLCLSSMLLGVVVGPWKIGSSPFLLLREVIDAPIFANDPNFVPMDGTGLSPLLQNYWMVIHPPVLFMGFALVAMPFACACAGLWRKELKRALQRALPWVLAAILVLGVGIVLGAVWAYETLNFGGYWNWDPVENAVYVPWLVLVVTLHMLILYLRRGVVLRGTLYAICASFWLVLYATFLIRSGILGNTSVHAFTDAGLSGQLIAFIMLMVGLGLGLLYKRRSLLGSRSPSYSVRNVELYLVLGVVCLVLMALQVLLPTSLPVWNAWVSLFGGRGNWAPPADAITFYSNTQLYFAIGLLFLSGAGQLMYWKGRNDRPTWFRLLLGPGVPALFVATWVIIGIGIQRLPWIWLLSAGIYALVANGHVLWHLLRRQPTLCAGALSHIGIACIVLGILFSSGYSRIVSTNYTGLIWHKDFPDEVNKNDILLFQHQKREMPGYTLHYKGTRKRLEGIPIYVPAADLEPLTNPLRVRAKVDIRAPDSEKKLYARKGDTLRIESPDKEYFEIHYHSEKGPLEPIYPSAQRSPQDESILYAPYILRGFLKDIYAHVRTFSDPEQATWSEPELLEVQPRASFFANDYVARILSMTRLEALEEVPLDTGDIALRADIEVLGPERPYYLAPTLIIKGEKIGLISDELPELGIRIACTGIYPNRDRVALQIRSTQVPWVILEVVEKPFINLLWGGVGLFVLGLVLGLTRHIRKKAYA